jgi:hypothetical protein
MYSRLRIEGDVKAIPLLVCTMKRGRHLFSQISRNIDATDMHASWYRIPTRPISLFYRYIFAGERLPGSGCAESITHGRSNGPSEARIGPGRSLRAVSFSSGGEAPTEPRSAKAGRNACSHGGSPTHFRREGEAPTEPRSAKAGRNAGSHGGSPSHFRRKGEAPTEPRSARAGQNACSHGGSPSHFWSERENETALEPGIGHVDSDRAQ